MRFPEEKFKPKKDRYSRARGGSSKFLYIACGNCEDPIMVYQKDGPGRLLRMYADRIAWPPELAEAQQEASIDTIKGMGGIACLNCETKVATPMVYEPESRPAYKVIQGTLHAYGSAAQALQRQTKQ